MASRIERFLIQADIVCDFIPLVSSLNNLIDLFQKYVIAPLLGRESGSFRVAPHYYTYLTKKKSTERCVMLLVPVLGNICIIIYKCLKLAFKNEAFLLSLTRRFPSLLSFANKKIRGNKDFHRQVFLQNPQTIKYMNHFILSQKGFIQDLITTKPRFIKDILAYTSHTLRSDKEFMHFVIDKDPNLLKLASFTLRGDEDFVRGIIQKDPQAVRYIDYTLLGNPGFIESLIKQNPEVGKYIQ